ncbi:MAG: hypothetical protein ABSG78_01870 [Verrucomicrobiota bacterium]|jgi:hypothetical protein
MNFLPIVHLEMRSAARRPTTYYTRCLIALLAISAGLGFVFAGFNRVMSTSSAGQAVFALLAGGGYVLLAAQAILLTCDCVSLEKREGTLGLLFLTDLNGFDIVAGKLAAQVSRSLHGLLAAFPAFGFCIILGGVGLGDFAKVALGLTNTLFYFAALGILISACVWRERAATAWGGLALLVPGALLPILCVMCNSPAGLALIPAGAMLAALSPVAGLASPPDFTGSLLVSHALGWLYIGAASCLVPRCWTRAANAAPARPSTLARQIKSPPQDLPSWALQPAKPLLTLALMVMICAVILAGALLGPPWMKAPAAPVTILLLHSVLKYQAAAQAGRMLAGKRRSGELELLLTTPYDEDEILRGCLLELKRSLFWPVLFALGVDLGLLILGCLRAGFGLDLGWEAAVVVEVVWLLVNLYSLTWVGLFLGLRLATPAKAASQAIFYVVLLPWVLLICSVALATPLVWRHRFGQEPGVPFAGIFVFALVFCNSFFPGWAINELRDRFRFLAAQAWTRS